jgi:hypothetical protein
VRACARVCVVSGGGRGGGEQARTWPVNRESSGTGGRRKRERIRIRIRKVKEKEKKSHESLLEAEEQQQPPFGAHTRDSLSLSGRRSTSSTFSVEEKEEPLSRGLYPRAPRHTGPLHSAARVRVRVRRFDVWVRVRPAPTT